MFNLCQPYTANCLSSYIKAADPCDSENTNKYIVLPNRNTPFVTFSKAAKTTELPNAKLFMQELVDSTMDAISTDVATFLISNGYEINGAAIEKPIISDFGCTVSPNCPSATYMPNSPFKGIRLQAKGGIMTTIQLNAIWLYAKQDYNGFTFYVRNYYNNAAASLLTCTVNVVAGKNNILELAAAAGCMVSPHLDSGTQKIDIFFDTSLYSNVCSIPLATKQGGGCCGSTGLYKSNLKNNCLTVSPITGTSSGLGGTNTVGLDWQNDSYGLDFSAICVCDFGALLCSLFSRNLLTIQPLINAKFQQLFAERVEASGRANCFALLKSEQYKEKANEFEARYNEGFNTLIAGLASTIKTIDTNCITCKPAYKISSNV